MFFASPKGEVAFRHVSDEMPEGSRGGNEVGNILKLFRENCSKQLIIHISQKNTCFFKVFMIKFKRKSLLNFQKGVDKVMFMWHDLASKQSRHNCTLF